MEFQDSDRHTGQNFKARLYIDLYTMEICIPNHLRNGIIYTIEIQNDCRISSCSRTSVNGML